MQQTKGIVLAGGSGTRLHPLTLGISKQLMPVYDKPMIYYPLSVLLLAGIREIAIISTPHDLPMFKRLLDDGSQWGVSFSYFEQARPEGIAQAFLLTADFIAGSHVCLVLGDNIFFGAGLEQAVLRAKKQESGATVFGYQVGDPQRYGVIHFKDGKISEIVEKPEFPLSPYAVTGLYFYDSRIVDVAKGIKPSARGELEITDVNNEYLLQGQLRAELFGRGLAWLDTGTHDSLLSASTFVQAVQNRQGLKVACLEEIAWRKGYISTEELIRQGKALAKSEYGMYLLELGEGKKTPWM